MNEPRTLPYNFRAFREDDLIYLFDNNEDVYLCSLSPAVWCDCIEHCPDDPDRDPDPWAGECSHYRDRNWINKMDTAAIETVEIDPDLGPDEMQADAWESAREAILCNNYGNLK